MIIITILISVAFAAQGERGRKAAKWSCCEVDMPKETIAPGGEEFSKVFSEVVSSAMTEVLGDTGSRAALYHVGPVEYEDGVGLHARLEKIFGSGALSLETVIVRRLALRVGVPVSKLRPDDIVKSVSLARALAEHRGKR